MPDHELGIFECSGWLSDKIPSPPFDVDQGGNLRKAVEAESLYCCALISAILKSSYFDEEFNEVRKGYDYESMNNPSNNTTYKGLLESWQAEQSFIINVIISAAKYKISNIKKDIEKFLKDGLNNEEVLGLSDLDINISIINEKYSKSGDLLDIIFNIIFKLIYHVRIVR